MIFTEELKYLGSLVHLSLVSDADVNKRVKSATAAFGSLRGVQCNFFRSETLRGAVYSTLVLLLCCCPTACLVHSTILLCGSEVWCLRDLFAKLRTFHSSCCRRAMCRITMARTIRHHILIEIVVQAPRHRPRGPALPPSSTLLSRPCVAYVPMSRVPRQLLTGWVAHPGPPAARQ